MKKNFSISNPRIKELLEKRLNENGKSIYDLSYKDAEMIINEVLSGQDKIKEYSEKNKEVLKDAILSSFKHINTYKEEYVINATEFMKKCLNDAHNQFILDYLLDNDYFVLGKVVQGHRISTTMIEQLFNQFRNLVECTDGVVINSKFVNDIIHINPDIKYDKETGEILENTTLSIETFIFNLKKDCEDLSVNINGDVYIITSKNFDDIKIIEEKANGLPIKTIPLKIINKVFVDETPQQESTEDVENDGGSGNNFDKNDAYCLYESNNPEDILLNGNGYGSGIEFMDDFIDVTITENNKIISDYFETDGGFTVSSLKYKLGMDIDEDCIDDCGVDFLILRDFVGKINLYVKVTFDDKSTIYVSPNDFDGDLYYDIHQKYGDSVDVDFYIDIDGTYSKSEDLTKDLYKKYN